MIRRQAMRLKLQLEFELEAKDKIDKHKKKENHAFEHLMDLIKVYLEKRARRKKRREEEKRLQLLEETARAQESGSDSSLGGSDSSFDSIATSYLHQRHGKVSTKNRSKSEKLSRESVQTRTTVASRRFRRTKSRGASKHRSVCSISNAPDTSLQHIQLLHSRVPPKSSSAHVRIRC